MTGAARQLSPSEVRRAREAAKRRFTHHPGELGPRGKAKAAAKAKMAAKLRATQDKRLAAMLSEQAALLERR